MSIPLVHVYTMKPYHFHASMSIPLVIANNMSQCLYTESRNSNFRNKKKYDYGKTVEEKITELQNSEILKCKFKEYIYQN